jgi:hypothetical protein
MLRWSYRPVGDCSSGSSSQRPALAQVALVAAAVITAAVLSSSPRYLSVAAGPLVTVTWRWSALPGTLVLIAVAPSRP